MCLRDVQRSCVGRPFRHGDLLRYSFEVKGDRHADGIAGAYNHFLPVRLEASGLNSQFVVARFEPMEAKLSACIRFGMQPGIGGAQFQIGGDGRPGLILNRPADIRRRQYLRGKPEK